MCPHWQMSHLVITSDASHRHNLTAVHLSMESSQPVGWPCTDLDEFLHLSLATRDYILHVRHTLHTTCKYVHRKFPASSPFHQYRFGIREDHYGGIQKGVTTENIVSKRCCKTMSLKHVETSTVSFDCFDLTGLEAVASIAKILYMAYYVVRTACSMLSTSRQRTGICWVPGTIVWNDAKFKWYCWNVSSLHWKSKRPHILK